MSIVCSNCQQENREGTMYCTNCGTKVYTQKRTQTQTTYQKNYNYSSEPKSLHAPPYYTKKYTALRSIASLISTFAIIYVVGMVIFGLISACTAGDITDNLVASLGTILMFGIGAAIGYVMLKAISESIYVIIDIEENTRLANLAMEKLLEQLKRN